MSSALSTVLVWQWVLVVGSSLGLLWLSPYARDFASFFRGRRRERSPNTWLLTSSLVISWLFAKSITNAANLGLDFGLVGGVGYAGYYLSFAVAGFVILRLRRRGGFGSIHEFLQRKHGRAALLVFSVLICFRLFNEIWSNTMVIGSYFGDEGSGGYLAAVLVFTGLTLAYSLKGGMSSSILTDAVQMGLFAVLLVTVLALGLPRVDFGETVVRTAAGEAPLWGSWTMAGGLDFLLVAVVQSLSYPFHDPVMTDRGFISEERVTERSFYLATGIGMACIIAFSLVGVFARAEGLSGQAPVEVARLLGVGAMLAMNLIMVTSAASTLDSSFSSFSKLAAIDLSRRATQPEPRTGRIAMAALATVGTVPVFFGPAVLSATTISGLMVVGLAPVFLLWWLPVPAISFHLAVLGGVGSGILLSVLGTPAWLAVGGGQYAELLGASLAGTALAFILFLTPRLLLRA